MQQSDILPESSATPLDSSAGMPAQISAVNVILQSRITKIMLFYVAHVGLGVIFANFNSASRIHAVVILLMAIWITLTAKPIYGIYAMAYIVGAELIWRMTDSYILYEGAKYYVGLLALLLVLRLRIRRISPLWLLLLLLFLPGIVMTLASESMFTAMRVIRGNFSAYLALFPLLLLFSNIRLSRLQVQNIFSFVIAPTLTIATLATIQLLTTANIQWTLESNYVASGGFGPNQISNALTSAVFFAVLWGLTNDKFRSRATFLHLIIAFWLSVQSILTFSRGGIFNTSIALLSVFSFIMIFQSEKRRVVTVVVVIGCVFLIAILPQLNDYVGGRLFSRYLLILEDSDLGAGRLSISQGDLQVFRDNVITGVGLGRSTDARVPIFGYRIAPHTEYTRLLAEQGIAGIAVIIVLFLLLYQNYRRQAYSGRMLALGFIVWGTAYISHAGTRTTIPMFMLGLSSALLLFDADAEGFHIDRILIY